MFDILLLLTDSAQDPVPLSRINLNRHQKNISELLPQARRNLKVSKLSH